MRSFCELAVEKLEQLNKPAGKVLHGQHVARVAEWQTRQT